MAIHKDLFCDHNFQSTIKRYCDRLNWKIAEISPNSAILKLNMESGTAQTVSIFRFQTTLEFSCPSGLKFSRFKAIPHELSSILLKENSKDKWGFWCIEEIENRRLFSIMYNAKISLMDMSFFRGVVETLVTQCERFESAAERAMPPSFKTSSCCRT